MRDGDCRSFTHALRVQDHPEVVLWPQRQFFKYFHPQDHPKEVPGPVGLWDGNGHAKASRRSKCPSSEGGTAAYDEALNSHCQDTHHVIMIMYTCS